MKKILLVVLAIMVVASVASAASIVGSAHDMRTYFSNDTTNQVCVYCHTPHMANGYSTDPLWNHSLSTVASYGVYSSVTMNATPSELAGSGQTGVLCMSCHDGTVAVNSVWNAPNAGNLGSTRNATGTAVLNAAIQISTNANLGTDLSNDHPVNFDYTVSATNDPGIRSTPTGTVVLFGNTVQCASCHNVHDPENAPFLRMANDGSALCLACHDK
jgi:predicted CXXCH cytochrome family protein